MSDKLITVEQMLLRSGAKPRGVKSGEIKVYKSSIGSGKSTFWEDLNKPTKENKDD